MTQKHQSEPRDWCVGRRLRAWELHEQDWKQKDIAAVLGVTPGTVSQWFKRGRAGGLAQLRHQPPPGAQPRLSSEQLTQLRALLTQGAEVFGFIGEVWTSRRVAAVIKRFLGVTYYRAHVSRLLHALVFSVQKPIMRAAQ